MDGQHNIRKGSPRWLGALLEIYNIFHTTAVHQILIYIIIFWLGKTNIARIDSQWYK
jgi:hypothetical protein